MSERLGIVDWGIGGLDLLRALRRAGSRRDRVYWSDAGAPPYGTLPPEALAERVGTVIEQLATMGCGRVAIACNAASTVLAHPELQRRATAAGCELVGVIAPTLAAIEDQGLTKVTVIGGRRTIASNAYADPLRAAGIDVTQRVAQPLSALIERGITQGPQLETCLAEILDPIADTEHLVLACTHYVAALPAISRRLPRLRTVVDPTTLTVAWIEAHWGLHTPEHDHPATERIVTTGSVEGMRTAGRLAFEVELGEIEAIGR